MSGAFELAERWHLQRSRDNWRGSCPLCGYPAALVLSERRGRALAWCANCHDQAGLAALVDEGKSAYDRRRPVFDEAGVHLARRKKGRALAIWEGGQALPGTLAETYLAVRAISTFGSSAALRFAPTCRHPEKGIWPALVALVEDVSGHQIGIHRTYLRRDGRGKADVMPPKASLGPIWGGAIRLCPVAGELLIGEGIETAAAAGALMGLPAWAAISAGNLASGLVLPPEVHTVVIAADPDPPGREAACTASQRWRAEGRRVRVRWPDNPDQDFNDVLRMRGSSHA